MNIKDTLRIFMPDFWLMNYKYNWKWDKILNDNISKGVVVRISACECQVGDVLVWVSNYPYGYGTPFTLKLGELPRPSRRTILKLKKLIDKFDGPKTDPADDFINAATVKS